MSSGSWVVTLAGAVLCATSLVGQSGAGPMRIDVSRSTSGTNRELTTLVEQTRAQADAFIFLSGGASRMDPDDQRRLLGMFDALAQLAREGHRFAVGDGGTEAGIMQASGDARHASNGAFPLIGIAPAREIPPRGETPVDPNHSVVVAVDDPSLPADQDGWGSETETMYEIFARLSSNRPSVTVVANGGGISLNEVAANVEAGRRMILIEGSGRAADALVALLRGVQPAGDELVQLRDRAAQARLTRAPQLFRIVPLDAGSAGLRDALADELFATP